MQITKEETQLQRSTSFDIHIKNMEQAIVITITITITPFPCMGLVCCVNVTPSPFLCPRTLSLSLSPPLPLVLLGDCLVFWNSNNVSDLITFCGNMQLCRAVHPFGPRDSSLHYVSPLYHSTPWPAPLLRISMILLNSDPNRGGH